MNWINLVEFQNPSPGQTAIAIASVCLSLIQAWFLFRQGRTIWRKRSGAAVATPWISFNIFVFFCNLLYGVTIECGTMIANSLLFVLYIYAAVGLWRYAGVDRLTQQLVVLGAAMTMAMIVADNKENMYLVVGILAVTVLSTQPIKLLMSRIRGVLDIWFVSVSCANALFLSIVGWLTDNLAMKIICPIVFLLLLTTILLWRFWCRNEG